MGNFYPGNEKYNTPIPESLLSKKNDCPTIINREI